MNGSSQRAFLLLPVFLLYCLLFNAKSFLPNFQYTYRDAITERFWAVSVSEKVVIDGHVSTRIRACPEKTKCLMGGLIQFAIPSDWLHMDTWTVNEVSFKKVGVRKIVVLGDRIDAYLITGNLQEIEYWYLMSEKRGLVAFGVMNPGNVKSDKIRDQYWLEERCGFAADASCE